jgi:hypothetical protein
VTPSSPFDELGEHELPEAADAPVTAGAQTSDVTEAVVEVRRQVTGRRAGSAADVTETA